MNFLTITSMLKTTSKIYIVSEYGGEYEDKWEHAIGVCSSLELAEQLKAEALAAREIKCNISEEEFNEMLDYLYNYEEEHGSICDSEEEGLQKLFPDKDPEDIEIACDRYFSCDDFSGIYIDEVNFYS